MALLLYCHLLLLLLHSACAQDLRSLLSFKASADPMDMVLHTWEGPSPCSGMWNGIKCHRRRVVGVYLDDAQLVGSVSALFGLGDLQVLSLRRNALSGHLPPLTNLTNPRLRHIFLSGNQLTGTLNMSLPGLRSLRVENNELSGGLEGLLLPAVVNFNVSQNNLSGEISGALSEFPSSAFGGNSALCGPPLLRCSKISRLLNDTTTSPSAEPLPGSRSSGGSGTINKFGLAVFLAIGLGDVLVISIALAVIITMYTWLKKRLLVAPSSAASTEEFEPEHVYDHGEKPKDRGLICFEGGDDLRLECLLKASAEVLGKGISGSTYKAVLDDGIMVAVKRLSAVQFPSNNKSFDRHIHLVGRLRHPNVVSLRAYCNAHEEKLLVYDYMPNGSLHSLLQSNSGGGNGRTLDWMSRKQMLMGAAQGLHFIHTFPARSPLVHANLKPSNILVDEQGNACVAECGIMCHATNFQQSLLPYSSSFSERITFSATATRRGYRAPELLSGKQKATQESDVYSFGMVLLEVVTDREVDEGECDGEMMGMVKIGMMCTAECPEERPKMSQVLRMLSEFS